MCIRDRYRLEADLYIGFGKDEINIYSINELYSLECANPFPNRKYNLYDSAKDFEKLKCIIEELTTILKRYGNRFFSSDMSLWEDLKNQSVIKFTEIDDAIKSVSYTHLTLPTSDLV